MKLYRFIAIKIEPATRGTGGQSFNHYAVELLYCTVLYCKKLESSKKLYCTVLYCTILYCNVLYCTVHCTVLYCTVLSGDPAGPPASPAAGLQDQGVLHRGLGTPQGQALLQVEHHSTSSLHCTVLLYSGTGS